MSRGKANGGDLAPTSLHLRGDDSTLQAFVFDADIPEIPLEPLAAYSDVTSVHYRVRDSFDDHNLSLPSSKGLLIYGCPNHS